MTQTQDALERVIEAAKAYTSDGQSYDAYKKMEEDCLLLRHAALTAQPVPQLHGDSIMEYCESMTTVEAYDYLGRFVAANLYKTDGFPFVVLAVNTIASALNTQPVPQAAGEVSQHIKDHVLKMGKIEWGATSEKSDADHIKDFENTLRITREHFSTEGNRQLHGVYLDGQETVVGHTGTSPNSPIHAQIIAGLWNRFVDECATLTLPSEPVLSEQAALGVDENKPVVVRIIKEDLSWKGSCGRVGQEFVVVRSEPPWVPGWRQVGGVRGFTDDEVEIIPWLEKYDPHQVDKRIAELEAALQNAASQGGE